jgi:hypothetical protein
MPFALLQEGNPVLITCCAQIRKYSMKLIEAIFLENYATDKGEE